MTDMQMYISNKFEVYIFKIALDINEYIRFAFLFVVSIDIVASCYY